MKEGWKYMTVKQCCDILDSKRKPITKSKRVPGSIPYYGATGLLDYVKDYIFDEDLVLLGEDGAKWGAGENSSFKINGKSWVNNHAHVLKPHRDILDDDWLIYYLNYSDLKEYITGVTVPKLNQERMCSIPIPVPPLSEQESIVTYLDTAFAKIDAIKQNAEKSLADAKALFQSALKEMMTPKEGWEEKTLGDIAEIKGGKRIPKGCKLQKEPTAHKYIRVADFNDYGTVDLDDIQYISDDIYDQIKRYIINKEDIYLSIAGTIGKTGIIPPSLDGANLTENACRLILSKDVFQKYIYYMTLSSDFRNQEEERTMKSAQPKLALTRLATINIAYPKYSEQIRISESLDSLSSKVSALEENYKKTIAECNAMKQALLRQVFE